jgi:hypothetical protein
MWKKCETKPQVQPGLIGGGYSCFLGTWHSSCRAQLRVRDPDSACAEGGKFKEIWPDDGQVTWCNTRRSDNFKGALIVLIQGSTGSPTVPFSRTVDDFVIAISPLFNTFNHHGFSRR